MRYPVHSHAAPKKEWLMFGGQKAEFILIIIGRNWLTVSKEAEAFRSGRKPTSNMWSRKAWSSIPYTLSRKSTIGALWSGQKQADMSGSDTVPSKSWGGEKKTRETISHNEGVAAMQHLHCCHYFYVIIYETITSFCTSERLISQILLNVKWTALIQCFSSTIMIHHFTKASHSLIHTHINTPMDKRSFLRYFMITSWNQTWMGLWSSKRMNSSHWERWLFLILAQKSSDRQVRFRKYEGDKEQREVRGYCKTMWNMF